VETLFGDQFRLWNTFNAVSVAPSVTIMIILLQPVLSKKIGSSGAYFVAKNGGELRSAPFCSSEVETNHSNRTDKKLHVALRSDCPMRDNGTDITIGHFPCEKSSLEHYLRDRKPYPVLWRS
jgi:hypothetical protein